jgi:hypothetical protein
MPMKRTPRGLTGLPEPATSEEALAFVREVQKRGGKRTPEDMAHVAAFIDSKPLGELRGIARRIMMDMMKSPLPGGGPASRGARQPRRSAKPATKKRRTRAKKADRAGRKIRQSATRRRKR